MAAETVCVHCGYAVQQSDLRCPRCAEPVVATVDR